LIAAGTVAIGVAGGAALILRARDNPRATAAIARGRRILRDSMPGTDPAAAAQFREAIARDARNAEAWGLLALALRNIAEQAPPANTATAVAQCEAAARRALELDRSEPNALTALATVQPEFGNWGESEDGIRAILREAPNNVPALTFLVMLLQSVGRAKESWDFNERGVALEPLSPVMRFRRALKLWIMNRVPEADLEIDRALQLWPSHPGVWNARLYIFAFTGRAEAALAMLIDAGTRPPKLSRESVTLWTKSLRALATRSTDDIARAREANIYAAPRSPAFGVQSTMILSMLGELDAAFGVAEGLLLRRGPLVGTLWSSPREFASSDSYWRRTMNLFTPATAAMRRDPRFDGLCDGMGLTRYWREKGVGPDRFLMA
jgi:tetratricopeptide (TPR) repeat protein